MSYITKNYSTDGGDTLVIGGTLKVEAGATVEGLEGGGGATAWADITGKPAVIAVGADQAAARTAIGAGTSSLVIGTTAGTALAGNTALLAIGTTATTAKAGNAVQTATQTTATAIAPGTATNVQAILAELATRIAALEAAAG
ncbi:hypothetical protein [Ochrobactrum chromiisoli]|uniref:Head decoration protein n=1 Tax=Ochrobactrum chromiisoli TaxID=2993941 RepID=A0ABT3QM91_9HYPH|nr:hypothetical protein [Ochrobactrum chromiisoli]MCX2696714.1 hypothetical protein [Ochrobactrum chromiisoli]